MLSLLMIFMFLLFLSFLLIILNFFISKKMSLNREKLSPFECGFDPMSNSRMPFSIQFFLISLIFLIFDIEISLIIPIIFMINFMNKFMIMSCMFFLLILIIATYIEYMEKSIDWKI